jgi:hypothetical protein
MLMKHELINLNKQKFSLNSKFECLIHQNRELRTTLNFISNYAPWEMVDSNLYWEKLFKFSKLVWVKVNTLLTVLLWWTNVYMSLQLSFIIKLYM